MIAVLRALAVIFFATLLVALAFGIVLSAGPEASRIPFIAAASAVVGFAVPVAAVYFWMSGRTRGVEELARQARASLAATEPPPIPVQQFRGDVAQLARSLEEWRLRLLDLRTRVIAAERMRGRILDGIGDGVLAINRNKEVILANRRLLDLVGVDEPMIGSPFYRLIRHVSIHAALDGALEGRPVSDIVSIGAGESERQVNVHAFPLDPDSGVAAVAIFIDVTRIVHLERIRRDFLSDFSHEVRTPLAGIRSAVETLEGGGLDPGQQEQLWGVARRQLMRLERLVHDLSELNRIESGELELVRTPTDLTVLLREVAAEFAELAAARNVSIALTATEAVRAEIDPQRVQQIASNLIDNAIKFSPRGSQVRLGCRRVNDSVAIEVTDCGEGISPEEQGRIFNRFYRIDRSRSQEIPGTGLGLAIVKHLTAVHGGRIEVESAPGMGSTFRVILPTDGRIL